MRGCIEIRKDKQIAYVDYLLGYIHYINTPTSTLADKNENKFKGSENKAKQFLCNAIDSDKPIEDAFCILAIIEDNPKHAVRILKKGLGHFPNSESIYNALVAMSEDSAIPQLYREIENKNIESHRIYSKLYVFFSRQKNYKEIFKIIERIKAQTQDEERLFNLIKAFCLYESAEIEKSKVIFQKLIEDDVNHKLNFGQYIGLLLCYSKTKETNKIIRLINELPNKFEELFTCIHYSYLGFNFEDYFNDMINRLPILLKANKEAYAKLRGIKALKACEDGHINNKTFLDLKFARNNLKDKKIFDTELVTAYSETNQIIEAFDQDIKNILGYSNYESEIYLSSEDIPEKDLKIIADSFVDILSMNSWQIDKFIKIAEKLISAAYEKKHYGPIIKISDYFSEHTLEKTNTLFEIAYAYGELGNNTHSKKFYQKIWNKEQTNSAVANNLALLYEDEADYIYAIGLFKKAIELDPDSKAKNNLKRLNEQMKSDIDTLENIKNENIYIHQKLTYLIDDENEAKHIIASYKRLAEILETNPEKAQELIKSFLEKNYIIKVEDHSYDMLCNVYRLNHSIRGFVLENEKRIKKKSTISNYWRENKH
jgi:tetratricopeptide (TPR) repeat protein